MVSHDWQAAPRIPRRLEVRLPATPKAAATARRALSKLDLPLPMAFDAQVAVSELVTNSVRHAGLAPDDLIRITAHWSGTRLRVHVRDRRPGPHPTKVSGSIRPAPGAESGWGLYLVDRLASRWGTSASGYWFELHQKPPSTAASREGPPRPRPLPGSPPAWPPARSGRSRQAPAPRRPAHGRG
jgi:anti-sigma regulatory factor (Ser/Thr protein kinase)